MEVIRQFIGAYPVLQAIVAVIMLKIMGEIVEFILDCIYGR
jgi:hypothetical protein